MSGPTIADSGEWSAGVTIGLPVTIVCLLLGALLVVLAARSLVNGGDGFGCGLVATLGISTVVVTALILALGFAPHDARYHQFREVSGVVETNDTTLVSSGGKYGGSYDLPLIYFEGSPEQYPCGDTRCAVAEPGDTLTLTCKPKTEPEGAEWMDCRYVALDRSTR